MNENDLISWFQDIASRGAELSQGIEQSDYEGLPNESPPNQDCAHWTTDASAALGSVFPAKHPVRVQWDAALVQGRAFKNENHPAYYVHAQLVGIVQSALGQLRSGRLRTLEDGIRAATVSEVLDQAETLLRARHHVAAMVLTGGALETHLLHLCTRHGGTWPGAGSISKYADALATQRNSGVDVKHSAADTSAVKSWGQDRNDAAHDPTNFPKSAADVALIIQQVRGFVSKTA